MEIRPGDLVQLKSGGRSMTVVKADKASVDVIWYAESDDTIRNATPEGQRAFLNTEDYFSR